MKKLIFASLILISQAAIAVNCPPTLGFSFPLKPRTNYSTISNEPEKACLDGKNITNWLTEGDILTSFLKAEGTKFNYVTTRNAKSDYFKMLVVYQLKDGRPYKRVILDANPEEDFSPKTDLQNMTVDYYDKKNSILLFSTDAWAQSEAIHLLKFRNNDSYIPIYEKFLTDGGFHEFFDSKVITDTIDHDDDGAFFPTMEVGLNGKAVCEIDTRPKNWESQPACLPNGGSLKKR